MREQERALGVGDVEDVSSVAWCGVRWRLCRIADCEGWGLEGGGWECFVGLVGVGLGLLLTSMALDADPVFFVLFFVLVAPAFLGLWMMMMTALSWSSLYVA